ncbi:MAG: preprotein translocase subunit SecE [Candidatus Omnitrophica bacterium]|nr:preprotein translocase subunit SecE [Candidatus Omnitrophota bacterium]
MIQRAIHFLKEIRSELSQVSWSSPQELWGSTKVVLVTVALLSLVIGIFDLVCARLMSWMIR